MGCEPARVAGFAETLRVHCPQQSMKSCSTHLGWDGRQGYNVRIELGKGREIEHGNGNWIIDHGKGMT